jgi:hypothetical protein
MENADTDLIVQHNLTLTNYPATDVSKDSDASSELKPFESIYASSSLNELSLVVFDCYLMLIVLCVPLPLFPLQSTMNLAIPCYAI